MPFPPIPISSPIPANRCQSLPGCSHWPTLPDRPPRWVIKGTRISPKLEPSYGLCLSIIRAMEVALGGLDMGMPHQILDGLEVDPFIQEGGGESMAHHVGMDSFPD